MHAPVSMHDSRRATKATLRAVVLLSIVLTFVFFISFVFRDRGISELPQSRRRVDQLRTEIRHLHAENARIKAEIESVKKSTYAVERIAREDLGMARRGEVIYMLPKKR